MSGDQNTTTDRWLACQAGALMEQVQALNAQLPARIRPLVPVAIAMALAVFLVIPGPLLRAFALGMVCGPILLAGVAVLLVISLMRAAAPDPRDSFRTAPLPAVGEERQETLQKRQEFQQLLADMRHDMAQAPPGEIPPYPIRQGGEYKGWLWTVGPDHFDTSQTLANWPPSIAGSCKWWASLQGRRLVLAHMQEQAADDPGQQHKRDGKAARAPSSGAREALVTREIDLEGCRVDILMDAIRGRSRWLRKAPLELSHASRPLLEGGQSRLLLFAAGSAAKEQWHAALAAACAPDGGPGAAIEALYEAFCERARAAASVPYAQDEEEEEAEAGDAEAGQGSKGGGRRRWRLSQWLSRGSGQGRRGSAKQHEGAEKGTPKGDARDASQRQASGELAPGKETGPAPVMNPIDMDKLWMGARHRASPKQLQRGDAQPGSPPPFPSVSRGPESRGLSFTAEDTARSASAPLPEQAPQQPAGQQEDMGMELRELSAAPRQPSATSRPRFPWGGPRDSSAVAGPQEPQDDSTGDVEGLSEKPEDYSSEDDDRHPISPSKAHTILLPGRGADGAKAGGRRGSRRHAWRQAAAAQLPALPVEAAANLLLARAGFDLLRSVDFKQRVAAHVQRKLGQLRVPEYIHSLEVVDVDMGSSVPTITNLRALPCPTDALWPQVVFDLDYPGGLVVIIEAKVELRDSAGWDTLDRAITRLGGVASAAVEAGASAAAAAAVATVSGADAAGVMSPGDSEDDDVAGEGGGDGAQQRRKRFGMGPVRKYMATRIRHLAEATAEQISKMHLRVRVDIHSLQGTVCAWVPPPPNDRLWFGFVSAPELRAEATPLLNQNIGAHMLMASYRAAQVPAWVGEKLQSAIGKNLTLPSCADIPLPHLLALDSPGAADVLPSFLDSLHAEGAKEAPGQAGDEAAQDAGPAQARAGRRARAASGPPAEALLPPEASASGQDKAEAAKPHHRFTLHWPRRSSARGGAPKAPPHPLQQEGADEAAAPPAPHGRARRRAERQHSNALQQQNYQRERERGQRGGDEGEEPGLALEMSAFATAAEHAQRGQELRALHSVHSAGGPPAAAAPAGATAQGPAVADPLRVAAVSTVVLQDGVGTVTASAALSTAVPPDQAPPSPPAHADTSAQLAGPVAAEADPPQASGGGSGSSLVNQLALAAVRAQEDHFGGDAIAGEPALAQTEAGTANLVQSEASEQEAPPGRSLDGIGSGALRAAGPVEDPSQRSHLDRPPSPPAGACLDAHMHPPAAAPAAAVDSQQETPREPAEATLPMDIRGTGAVPLPPLADPEPLGEDTHESQAADEVLGSLQRQAIAEEEEEQDRQGAHAGQPLSEPEPPAGRASASAQLPLDAGEGDAVSPSGKWRQLSGSVGKKYLEQLKSRNSLALAQGKKLAESLAGQAQEQMRKALASSRDRATKEDKKA